MRKYLRVIAINTLLLLTLASCQKESSVFTATVETIPEPEAATELSVDKIESDYLYSEYFAVFDSLLISSCPNSGDSIFYVSDIKNNKYLGGFMSRGQGPNESVALAPIKRIERKGNDLVALTYDGVKHCMLDWNITESIKTGGDSLIKLGFYQNPNEFSLTYSAIYKLGNSKYVGYVPSITIGLESGPIGPSYWIFEGSGEVPTHGISIVKDIIRNNACKNVSEDFFFSSAWCLSPDNSKIADAMHWLNQINIIDVATDSICSYRVEGSPDESIFETTMEHPIYQYKDVACSDSAIYALYFGDDPENYKGTGGCMWLHEFDWDGNFKRKYHLPVSLLRIWMDPSSNTLYGFNEPEHALYKLNVEP